MKRLLLGALAVVSGGCGGGVDEREPSGEKAVAEVRLFDGASLKGWRQITDWEGGGGSVEAKDGTLVIGAGDPMNGVVIDDEGFAIPKGAYELQAEVCRIEGDDFFLGLTFPVPGRDVCMTFVAGGWGGGTTGFSSIGGMDASMNATGSRQRYENGKWYAFRIQVSGDRLKAWIDGRIVASAGIRGKVVGMRPGEVEMCQPLGLCTWRTKAALRKLVIAPLPAD